MLLFNLISNPQQFIGFIVAILIAITIHEFAHAWTANYYGDSTAKQMGRLTLNPLAHLDLWGTIFLLIAGFGWGKPVPFDPYNLRHPKKDSAVISFAGPFSNFVMAIISALVLRFMTETSLFTFPMWTGELLYTFIRLNVLLGVFNLVPVHPLDGFKVVAGLLPQKYYHDWMDLQKYGMIFLIFLIFPFFGRSPVFTVISPVINFILSLLIPSSLGGII